CIPPVLIALRVRGDAGGPSAERALGDAVRAYVELLVNAYNQLNAATMGLQTVLQDKAEVKFLTDESMFPPGFRPAFALKGGYLLLATSPEAIRRFPATPPGKSPAAAAEVPFARFSPPALAGFLKARRDSLSTYLALIHQLPRQEIEQRLENLRA